MPLSTEEDVRARKRRRTKHTQYWTKFRVDNIQKYHREQHAKQWAEYIGILKKKHTDPMALKAFFKQSRLEAFFEQRVVMEGRHRILCVEKKIVDVECTSNNSVRSIRKKLNTSRLTLLSIRGDTRAHARTYARTHARVCACAPTGPTLSRVPSHAHTHAHTRMRNARVCVCVSV